MASTTVPDFFDRFPMRPATSAGLDEALSEPGAEPLTLLFLWGENCPNCDVAKRAMLQRPERFDWPQVRWLHANVYDDPEIGTRFGLHGVPAFLLFRGRKKIGRITGWPGAESFVAVVTQQIREMKAHPVLGLVQHGAAPLATG
ncbi:thioredoxin family protein [Roseomonas sp. OT10]|uniref:thioredoxin family protein n=1 Tax=Roseomonas cutis TaxID=2897332 RepID=UPI001E530205|nr:thioredoxin family protein [Roseomonas sp. OT10]UFN50774.1 thioredoxin family protein [Roseomonas sp. OT10]